MSTQKKSNHQANIVRIEEGAVKVHPNADRLELVTVGGYQVVSQKGQFKPGDLAVYIQPDSVVPQTEPFHFIWGPYAEKTCADPMGYGSPVSERRRRITVKRFRGEYSEGLLLPVTEFGRVSSDVLLPFGAGLTGLNTVISLEVGADVSDALGIAHYDPDAGKETGEDVYAPRKKRLPGSLRGWFYFILGALRIRRDERYWSQRVDFTAPVYDVEAYKNHRGVLQPGEEVYITEKIHGSNARYVFLKGTMYAGSRNLWKSPKSNCIWRKALLVNPWIEEFCRTYPGYIVYGEVTPTQKGFDYGATAEEPKFFLFDVYKPGYGYLDKTDVTSMLLDGGFEVNSNYGAVPLLYVGPFSQEVIEEFVSGQAAVIGARHIREGIVIRPLLERRTPGLDRVILKVVSNEFLERDSKEGESLL